MDLSCLSTPFDPSTCYKIRHPRAFSLQLLRSIKPPAQRLQLRTVETQKCCLLQAAGQRNLVGEVFVITDPTPRLSRSQPALVRPLFQKQGSSPSSLGSQEDLCSYSTRKGQRCKPTATELPLPRGNSSSGAFTKR